MVACGGVTLRFPPGSFLTSGVWCLQNGALWRRATQQVRRRRRWWWRWWRGCRRTRGARPRRQQARWAPRSAADVQAVDGPESPDHGPVQPHTRPAELPNGQPLPLPLQRRQRGEEVRQKNHRMAISFHSGPTKVPAGVCWLECFGLRCGLNVADESSELCFDLTFKMLACVCNKLLPCTFLFEFLLNESFC